MNKIGRYEIIKELGRGGMATVYLARDLEIRREVAIKVLPAFSNPAARARFQREAEIVAKLEHSAIVPIYDFGEHDDSPFLVMRYMAGGSLSDRLAAGPMKLAEAADILARIAPAVDFAHKRGIIHRDLKPDNLLFDHDGQPYIADFGIAKITAPGVSSMTGTRIIGTPLYMSPEQFGSAEPIDARADIYALGVILYEMLSGEPPFMANTPAEMMKLHLMAPVPAIQAHIKSLPSQLQPILERALAKERGQRYATAQALADAVAEHVIDRPKPASPTRTLAGGRAPGGLTPPRKARRFWGFAALSLVLIITLLLALKPALKDTPLPSATVHAANIATPLQVPAATTPPTFTLEPAEESPVELAEPTAEPTAPPTPQAGDSRVNPLDQAVIIFIPAGEFMMGLTEAQLDSLMSLCPDCNRSYLNNSLPAHPVALDSFWIYRTEVTNAQYAQCVTASMCRPPDENRSGTRSDYFGNPAYANYPVVFVDWLSTTEYCAWAQARLPTEAEWERAARGDDGRLFPWGDAPPNAQRANFGGNVGNTTEAGAYPEGASPYGILDMAGNVWEWVSDWYEADYYEYAAAVNPQGPDSSGEDYRAGRGGNWNWDHVYASAAYHDWWDPEMSSGDVGFRCALDASP